jgi:class 3 adenylate cyclase
MVREAKLVILFADVCESTMLYERVGNLLARDAISQCLSIMEQCTERQGGQVIKTIGDEVMATFASPNAAADAASEMHEFISNRLVIEGRPITIRAGFYFGSVLVDDGDVYGDAVNTAARIAAEAKSRQILTAATTVARMSQAWQNSTRPVARANLRGKRSEIDMVEVIWRREDLTRISDTGWGLQQAAPSSLCLVLGDGDREIKVGEQRPIVAIGRADDNDLVIKHNLSSRLHARIEYSKGHFLLVDRSINGTYVLGDDGEERFVRRDSRLIHGAGVMGFGRTPRAGSVWSIAYRCEE